MTAHFSKPEPSRKDNKLFWLAGALFSALYLLNPTMGLDALPDVLPLFGNMDEAAATAFLLYCLSRLGVPLPFHRPPRNNSGGGPVVDI